MRRLAASIALLCALFCCAPALAAPSVDPKVEAELARAKATMVADPAGALAIARTTETLAGNIADASARDSALARAWRLEGDACLRLNRLDDAATYLSRAFAAARRYDPHSGIMGEILLTSAGYNGVQGKAAQALVALQRAFRIFQATHDERNQAITLLSIASLYNDARDNESALKYLSQAEDAYKGDQRLSLVVFNNRGNAYQDLDRFADAERDFNRAYHLARLQGSVLLQAQILRNIVRNRLKAGHVDDALPPLKRAMALSESGDAAPWRPQLLAVAAEAALQQHRLVQAGELIDRSFAGVDLATTTLPFREAHNSAYRIFTALHQPDKALAHLIALKRLDDEATKLATQTNTALMGARFNFANQELRIAKLKADELRRSIAFEQTRARTERLVFLGAAIATVILIAVLAASLFTIRRSRNEVRAANADLAVTNDALGKALAAKTEFLATTSHEIRTPLNGILGMTEVMLADPALTAATRDRLTVVHGAGVTMRALVDDILDVAKMETGNLTIEDAPFDLAETVAGAARMWEEQARAKGLGFVADLKDCPGAVLGDAARVRQIVFNLLANALKFTEAGEIGIAVGHAEGGDRFAITISDTGIGIPAEKQRAIFDAFRQADTSTTRRFGGTGLGLAICRNLARAMGGDVAVDSRAGEGARFTVTLPLVAAPVSEPAAPCVTGASGGGLLVVDRNPITRSMWRTLFHPHEPHLVFVGDLDEADAALAAGGLCRVLVDDGAVRTAPAPEAALATLAATARRVGSEVVLLWPDAAMARHDDLIATGIDRIVGKPVKGAALVANLFDTSVEQRLVTHAA